MEDIWTLYDSLLRGGRGYDQKKLEQDMAIEALRHSVINDPSYQENSMVEGERVPLIVNRKSGLICEFKAFPEQIVNIGDLVECFDQKWLIVECYVDKIGLINGEMWLCNKEINYQNISSSTVFSQYCVADNGAYNKDTSTKPVVVMTNTYDLYLPLNEFTKYFYVGKRLALGKAFDDRGAEVIEAYKIVGIDIISKNVEPGSHLSIITLQRDVYAPDKDNIEKLVCDFDGNVEPSPIPVHKEIYIDGPDVVRIGTQSIFTAKTTTKNVPEIEWQFPTDTKIIFEAKANILTLTVPLDIDLIGEEINISAAEVGVDTIPAKKKVQVITLG